MLPYAQISTAACDDVIMLYSAAAQPDPIRMNFLKLYGRVLVLLGPEARLGWILAGANVALAAAQFAEPVLFGRIIDALVKGQGAGATPTFEALIPLLAACVGFG